MSSGTEAANVAVWQLRRRAGDTIFPSVYRLEAGRLWLVAQAGYTGVYDGIGLDRGVMARAVRTGETQFVDNSAEVPDFLYAQPGFVSEVTCARKDIVFNLETTTRIDPSVLPRFEIFASFLADRVMSDESMSRAGSVARALAPMIALDDEAMVAEYAARIVGTRLGLDLCQAVIFGRSSPIVTTWRQPRAGIPFLDGDQLREAVRDKQDFAAWFGPAHELGAPWSGHSEAAVVVPIHRRGELVGGLVGAGGEVPKDETIPETLMAVATQTASCLERAALEQRLRRSITERSRFMAIVSHELRTPLTAIAGFTDVMLADSRLSSVERGEFLSEIRDGSEHMLGLVNDILEVARAEAGQLEVKTDEVVDLGEVATEAVRQVSTGATETGTRINMDLPGGTLVLGERLRVRQVFVNLLTNAVKFTPGGQIKISAHNGGRTVTMSVEDDGIGVVAEMMDTLFEPFTGHSLTVPGSGHGLGLVISRQLARAMGGDLRLTSDGVGQGTCATLILPKASLSQI